MKMRVYICCGCDTIYSDPPDHPCGECGGFEFTQDIGEDLFDADELGLDPEHDEERKYA